MSKNSGEVGVGSFIEDDSLLDSYGKMEDSLTEIVQEPTAPVVKSKSKSVTRKTDVRSNVNGKTFNPLDRYKEKRYSQVLPKSESRKSVP
jgi:hypothetical protein